ncbi:cell division control protein 45 homolog [Daphnia pulicaria]|uniref:cell division control protein 45 homolog n=1 Tax=Daphnia pulicaria TaxID=35523 RepID=UPI001EEAEE72|nr:cell division control protein 45 homolog [Daphnia pulicaria]
MFLSDLKREFYDVILGKRVLIFVNFDVDAIASCRILQYLLLCDSISYSIVPVQSQNDLISAYKESCEQSNHIILINCGGTLDIVETLEPSEEKIFYIADSHRPYDVCNIYNDGQVCILGKVNEKEDIPTYEDIFGNDDDDDDDEGSNPSDGEANGDGDDDEEEVRESKSKRQKLDPAEMVMRRREKRLWHEKRKEILFNYMQFSFYSSSTALLMFELAWKLSRDSNDLLWWAIIGVNEQQLLGKVESKTSVLDNGKLQSHMIRLAHLSQHGGESTGTKDALYITHEKDLNLSMYRHWSLLESLKYSPQTASHFQLWTLKGEKKLNEFLAGLGLPLSQCRQKFNSMDIELRNDLRAIFQKKVEKYDLEDLVEYSFNSQYGFRPKNSASDYVYALIALLDSAEKDKDPADAFHDALECLSNSKMDAVYKGIELAKLQQMAIGKEVHTCLDMGHVISAGPCLYAVIQDGTPDAKYYGYPHSLLMLGQFLLKAHISRARGRGLRARELPLIISAPSASRPSHCLLLGLPPLSLDSPKNLIGKAFEQAAENTQTEITSVFFDSSVIEINSECRTNFLDSLFSLLE